MAEPTQLWWDAGGSYRTGLLVVAGIAAIGSAAFPLVRTPRADTSGNT